MFFPQVTFDTSKHLSESALKRRSLDRLKLQELERQREEQKRREKEEEERRKEEERYDVLQEGNGEQVYLNWFCSSGTKLHTLSYTTLFVKC